MKNLEIKCRVARFDGLRRALTVLGAVRQTPLLKQVDWYFGVPAGRLKLRQANGGTGELIFYARPSSRGQRLSVWGRSTVPDVPAMRRVLANALGDAACVRKSREVWLFRNARIHLDRVSGLGTFLEIEVVVTRGTPQARALMDRLIGALALAKAPLIGGSYADLAAVRRATPPCR